MAEPAVAGNFEVEPLELIRKTEAGCRRRLAAARAAADTELERSRQDAEEIIREARATGRREGEARLEEIRTATLAETDAIRADAAGKAAAVRAVEPGRLETAVRIVLDRVYEREAWKSTP